MQTVAQKQNQPAKPVSYTLARPNLATPKPNHLDHPILQLQRTIGNQAVQRMLRPDAEELNAGLTGTALPSFAHDCNRNLMDPPAPAVMRPELTISKPGDKFERDADRVAGEVMRKQTANTGEDISVTSQGDAPVIRRACAKCPADLDEQEDVEGKKIVQRQEQAQDNNNASLTQLLSCTDLIVQRFPADGKTESLSEGVISGTTASSTLSKSEPTAGAAELIGSSLIVEDSTREVERGQMRKSEFLDEVRAEACRTVEEMIAPSGRTTEDCLYLAFVFRFLARQSAQYIERTLRQFAPEVTGTSTARDYIPIINQRVRQSSKVWLETGQITGLPEGVPSSFFRVEGSSGKTSPPAENVMFKGKAGGARQADALGAIRNRIGIGSPLDSNVKSRMESAFRRDFSGVRVHTDARAGNLSADLSARAFTIGNDIAFAFSEYRPGTLVGDALIAHELAHVIQQGDALSDNAFARAASPEDGSLEEEADSSAVHAVISLWGKAAGWAKGVGDRMMPSLRAGLRLQRCQEVRKRCPRGYSWRVQSTTGMGSAGCLCQWKCMPGERQRPSTQTEYRCPPEMNCSTGVRYEDLCSDYSKTGLGAAFTPLGEQAYCGCFPLNLEGERVSDSPLRPTDFEMTDVLGPAANVAQAIREPYRPAPTTESRSRPAIIEPRVPSASPTPVEEPVTAPPLRTLPPVRPAGPTSPRVTPPAVTPTPARPPSAPRITPEAMRAIESAGIKVSSRQLSSAGPSTIKFVNNFHGSSGFDQVMNAWAAGGKQQDGARFVMKYCAERLTDQSVIFEWPAGIKKTISGETWARYVDVVIRGGNKVNPGESIYMEFKSWTSATLAKSTGKIKQQLTRDRAMFDPNTIRWVFDSSKVAKSEVMDAFVSIIQKDEYLSKVWGGTEKEIRESLSLLVEVF